MMYRTYIPTMIHVADESLYESRTYHTLTSDINVTNSYSFQTHIYTFQTHIYPRIFVMWVLRCVMDKPRTYKSRQCHRLIRLTNPHISTHFRDLSPEMRHEKSRTHELCQCHRLTQLTNSYISVMCTMSTSRHHIYHKHIYITNSYIITQSRKVNTFVINSHDRFHWNAAPLKSTNPKTTISRYTFKVKHNLNLNLYREILRNLSISIWWILGVEQF